MRQCSAYYVEGNSERGYLKHYTLHVYSVIHPVYNPLDNEQRTWQSKRSNTVEVWLELWT